MTAAVKVTEIVRERETDDDFCIISFFLNFFFNVYLFIWDRERQSMNGGGAERERETQSRKQAPGFEPSAQSLTRGSNSQTARS